MKMGYNDVFKDILQPVETGFNCIGDYQVAVNFGKVCDGTTLEGIDPDFLIDAQTSHFLKLILCSIGYVG